MTGELSDPDSIALSPVLHVSIPEYYHHVPSINAKASTAHGSLDSRVQEAGSREAAGLNFFRSHLQAGVLTPAHQGFYSIGIDRVLARLLVQPNQSSAGAAYKAAIREQVPTGLAA
ncbi:hypothetical protein SCUP515_12410 [Seiridium cupressi]